MRKPTPKTINRYSAILERIFQLHYAKSRRGFEFEREEFVAAAKSLSIALPKNLGDVIYSARYRTPLPESIVKTAPAGKEWVIEGTGISRYRFELVSVNRIEPRSDLLTIKIPDSTPEIITKYALSDEQSLLAKVRYNRLVDVFLGITTYSLQNHLRTTVTGIGQIEIDEIYVGVDRKGRQFVDPVQAKGGKDKHGSVQTRQDLALCAQKFPHLLCRAISAQFMSDDRIALFELMSTDDGIKIVDEKHYQLVPAASISNDDLRRYAVSTT